jgi:serine/threonine protein phosphatase 1
MITTLMADAAALPTARPTLIFVGDYVDRGPGSREVVDMLIALRDRAGADVRLLRGNHDDSLLRFLEDPAFGPTWLRMGAAATLASYGITPPAPRAGETAWTAARDALSQALPAAHRTFFETLEPYAIVGDYLFVHAGVRPGVAADRQTLQDLMWIRDDFLQASHPSDRVVVHGHTPSADPYLGPERIGIDTGAYATSVLTAVRLHETAQNFMQCRTERGT